MHPAPEGMKVKAMQKMTTLLGLAALSGMALAEPPPFKQFTTELNASLGCKYSKMTPADEFDGQLYGCIAGKAETAKVFVNENKKTGKTLNMKLIWNDWFKEMGYGIHPDKADATRFINVLSQRLSPVHTAQMLKVFEGKAPATFSTEAWTISYTYERGPAIDERKFVFTPK